MIITTKMIIEHQGQTHEVLTVRVSNGDVEVEVDDQDTLTVALNKLEEQCHFIRQMVESGEYEA